MENDNAAMSGQRRDDVNAATMDFTDRGRVRKLNSFDTARISIRIWDAVRIPRDGEEYRRKHAFLSSSCRVG